MQNVGAGWLMTQLTMSPFMVSLVTAATTLPVFLVILPLTHLLRAMAPPGAGAPRIHTGFGDWLGAEGYPLPGPHRGIDVGGIIGADVLAAADRAGAGRGPNDS